MRKRRKKERRISENKRSQNLKEYKEILHRILNLHLCRLLSFTAFFLLPLSLSKKQTRSALSPSRPANLHHRRPPTSPLSTTQASPSSPPSTPAPQPPSPAKKTVTAPSTANRPVHFRRPLWPSQASISATTMTRRTTSTSSTQRY